MKEVIKKVPDAKLLILGRGPLYEYFDTYIKDNNLDNNIELLGFKPNIPDYLKKSKVFVITSYYEGLSNSLLEAMSYGIPVIASDSNGGNKEVIDDKYGILIPDFYNNHDIEDNEKLLAKEIIDILNNKKNYEYYSKKSLERAKDFDKNVIIKKWMDIL
jgi:N-acetylgalactosamine-N,N'-diacetylbacillosaminyl-diphospho-undecaprenol 4-alpha-N-acetylgalactosaminyltransferase